MHLLYNVISRQVSSDSQTLAKDLLSCKNTNWFRNSIRTCTSKIPSSRSFHTALFSWVIVSACIMELIFSSISSRLISEGCNTKRNILNKYCRHVMQYYQIEQKNVTSTSSSSTVLPAFACTAPSPFLEPPPDLVGAAFLFVGWKLCQGKMNILN